MQKMRIGYVMRKEKNKKLIRKIGKVGVCFGLAVMCLVANTQGASAKEQDNLKVNMQTLTKNSIKVSWKKKNVSKIVVKRYKGSYVAYMTGESKLDKTFTFSGKKKSFVDKDLKTDTDYIYKVEETVRKKGKDVVKFSGEAYGSTSVSEVIFSGNQEYKGNHDVNYIELEFELSDGLQPEGLDVFRKKVDSEEDYQVIATLDADATKYRDETVETYVAYKYKVKGFVLENGEKVYGTCDGTITKNAVKVTPECDAKVTIDKENKNLVLELKSQSGNADIMFSGKYLADPRMELKKQGAKKATDVFVNMTEYSYDNVTWKKFDKKSEQTFSHDGTIYIKFENYAANDKRNLNGGIAKKLNFYDDDVTIEGIENIDLKYDGFCSIGSLDMQKNVFTAEIDPVYYEE